MHHRSPYVLATLFAAALLLSACGGGGTGTSLPLSGVPTAPLGSASVTGQVLDVNGLTTNLGGIALSIPETGQRATTNADGMFDFGNVRAGTFTVKVDRSQWTSRAASLSGQGGMGGGTDDGMGGGMGDGTDDGMDGGHGGYDDGHDGYDDGHDNYDDGMGMGDHGGYDDDSGHDDGYDDGMGMGDHGDWMDEDDHYHQGEAWHEDEFEDGEDSDVDDVVIHRAQDEEKVHLRLRIHDGMIGEMQCIRDTLGEREVERMMTTTGENDDVDIHGKLELESRTDRERFKVRVEHATPGRNLDVYVLDLNGTSEYQGTRTVLDDGEARWVLDSSMGDSLPFGVDTVEELEGYRVEVRDGDTATALLYAVAPELPASDPIGTPGEDEGEGEDEDYDRGNGSDGLDSHEDGVEGHVEMRRRHRMGEERLRVQAEGLEPGRELDCYIEDADGSGTFEYVATIQANEHGVAHFEVNTMNGDDLPCNADRVQDMEGHEIELRDPDTGDVVLSGTMPKVVGER